MSKSARDGLKFTTIDEMVADAQTLKSGPYDKAGNWDLPYILAHLAKAMNGPFEAGGKNFPWPIRNIALFFYNQVARRDKYPKIKIPMPGVLKPAEGISLETAWSAFEQAANNLKAAPGPTIQCPPLGTLDLEDFRKVQLLHGAHHLSFLKPR